MAARERLCTARTRLFRLIHTKNMALRPPPPAYRSFADPSLLLSDIKRKLREKFSLVKKSAKV
jgi:hypothetical protein